MSAFAGAMSPAPVGPVPSGRYREKLFFALIPDRAAVAGIGNTGQEFRSACGLNGEVFADERFHVTLLAGALPGARSGDLIARMVAAGNEVSAGRFAVGFDQAMSFHRDADTHAFVLSSSDHLVGLEKLSDALERAMRSQGLVIERSSNPHLTMLYDAAVIPPTGVQLVRWIAQDFVLIRSLQGQSHYQFIERWPLRPFPKQ